MTDPGLTLDVPITLERVRRIEEICQRVRDRHGMALVLWTGCLNPRPDVGDFDTGYSYFDFAEIAELAANFCEQNNARHRGG
jgi:hypothetical protein